MNNNERFPLNATITAEKDGAIIHGKITAIQPELTYEITQENGDLRSVDHCHIISVLRGLSEDEIMEMEGCYCERLHGWNVHVENCPLK